MKTKPDILIFGRGFIGQAAERYFGERAVISRLHSTNLGQIRHELATYLPKIVINAAGRTNTTSLEQEIGVAEGVQANVVFPLNLGLVLDEMVNEEKEFRLFHFSTGMVTEGPGMDSDGQSEMMISPNRHPSVYSNQKLLAEKLLASFDPRAIENTHLVTVLRIHLPFSAVNHPRNFFIRMKKFDQYLDEPSSMICIEDVFGLIEPLANSITSGVVHATNPGFISPFQIALAMKELGVLPSDKEIIPLNRNELDRQVASTGGAYQPQVMLKSDRLIFDNIQLRPIEEAVLATLEQMAELTKV